MKGRTVVHQTIGYTNNWDLSLVITCITSHFPTKIQRSIFGGSSWTYNLARKQYYYHVYGPDQPDLNLRSAKIQDELKKVVRHWLDNGVSGFRLLSVPYLYESENTTLDEPPIAGFSDDSYATLDHIYTTNLNEDYNFVGEVRAILQEYEDIDEAHR